MASNIGSKAPDAAYKNVQFWICDVIKMYKLLLGSPVQLSLKNPTEKCDVKSSIKTLTVIGVVVGVRNEKKENICDDNINELVSTDVNRPIVYGMYGINYC